MSDGYWPEDDWPLPVRVVCDTPEAVMEAIATLPTRGEVVIVEHEGKRVAAIIAPEDLEMYQTLFAQEEERLDNEAVDRAIKEAGGIEALRETAIPWDQVKAELNL